MIEERWETRDIYTIAEDRGAERRRRRWRTAEMGGERERKGTRRDDNEK